MCTKFHWNPGDTAAVDFMQIFWHRWTIYLTKELGFGDPWVPTHIQYSTMSYQNVHKGNYHFFSESKL